MENEEITAKTGVLQGKLKYLSCRKGKSGRKYDLRDYVESYALSICEMLAEGKTAEEVCIELKTLSRLTDALKAVSMG